MSDKERTGFRTLAEKLREALGRASKNNKGNAGVENQTAHSSGQAPNRSFADAADTRTLSQDAHAGAGVRRDTSHDAREVVLGLDFGTSCTKAVIRDTATRQAFSVPFRPGKAGIDTYLLPTGVEINDRGEVRLGNSSLAAIDLKVRLMRAAADGVTASELLETKTLCAAYLGLVIRYCKAWLIRAKRDLYGNAKLDWWLTTGTPTSSLDDVALTNAFRDVARIAWVIAEVTDSVTKDNVRKLCASSRASADTPAETERINVYPEVAAEIVGYARSDARRAGLHLMIDVGASTLDVSTFMVPMKSDEDPLSFLQTSVTTHGVYFLHRHRTEKLAELIKARCNPLDQMSPIPERAGDLLPNEAEITKIDETFSGECAVRIASVIQVTKAKRAPNEPQFRPLGAEPLPVFICGGGSRMRYYRNVVVNAEQRLRNSGVTNLGAFRLLPLAQPADFIAEGLPATDYHRLAVAHGLSFPWLDMPPCKAPRELPDLPKTPPRQGPDSITKDQM